MMFRISYSVLMCSVLLMFGCTSKKAIIVSSKETLTVSADNGFFPMFVYHNAKVSQASHKDEGFYKIEEFSISNNLITHAGNTVVNLERLDKKFSYLIDYFKDAKGTYLILSEVNSDNLQSSSDFNTLPRNKLLICDLSTGKKYAYSYTSLRNGLILPTKYYETLRYGTTIKSIDTATKFIVFEKDYNSVNPIKVPMVEVASYSKR